MKKLYFFITAILLINLSHAQWTQFGNCIVGEALGDGAGSPLSLSSNGSIIAIGACLNDDNGEKAGHVRIFKIQDSIWTQIGSDIDGETEGDLSGYSVSLSSDGKVVAIGAPEKDEVYFRMGQVRVFKNINNDWIQVGNDILGEACHNTSGTRICLNSNGSVVAVGATRNHDNGVNAGHVRVYKFKKNEWRQIGSDIDGEAAEDKSSSSLSISSDGKIIAIGASENDGNGDHSGHVRVYKFKKGKWLQFGNDIDGETERDASGCSLSLSSDGSIVAIGAYANRGEDKVLTARGHVRVYKNVKGNWIQVGNDINGENENDWSGTAVSLSSDGSIVAIGASFNSGNGYRTGHTRVFKNIDGEWSQIGDDIDGAAEGDLSGSSISLSANGFIVAVGSSESDRNRKEKGPGNVKIYKFNTDIKKNKKRK